LGWGLTKGWVSVFLAGMFTGIIESTGEVAAVEATPAGGRLVLRPEKFAAAEVVLGESVAVNGCCLTVADFAADGEWMVFDLLRETLAVTNLGGLAAGDRVNLERALRLGDRLSGHLVQGHVDATGVVRRLEAAGGDWDLEVELPPGRARQVIPRGSIAIDGISLTAAEVAGDGVTCHIIPHTWQETRLHTLSAGARVNLEFDMIGKFVARLLEPQ